MNKLKFLFSALLLMAIVLPISSRNNPKIRKTKTSKSNNQNQATLREPCAPGSSQISQSINNVRARLLINGDVWWDGFNNAKYVVPKVEPGLPEVSSIFAGAVWIGGRDNGNNLKLAAKTYGSSSDETDFWPGPINATTLDTEADVCENWDKHFTVLGDDIRLHLSNWADAKANGVEYDSNLIPPSIKGWPARGNEFFFDIHGFTLPENKQGLAGFYDRDADRDYEPDDGDYPIIGLRGCDPRIAPYPDEMVFWIYNDVGNVHTETDGDPLQMEIQVQSFAYATNDQINNMTFQKYNLINRGQEDLFDTYFGMWVDPDLGCDFDDYVGCDTTRSLAYVYNSDATDGTIDGSCVCDESGVATYCDDIPLLGIDYFRSPFNEFGEEIGMSSFTYYNNSSATPPPPPGTGDPRTAQEYYNLLSGFWGDGTPFSRGGDGYSLEPGAEWIKYAFPDPPRDDNNGTWSMAGEMLENGDRRTIQASGPFTLQKDATNELVIGVVWVADIENHPRPDLGELLFADDLAQSFFDRCFILREGPDPPDIDWLELDQEVVGILTNDTLLINSNNSFESYAQPDYFIPPNTIDSNYVFEGYQVFQLRGPNNQFNDPENARLVFQVDVKNGVSEIFNWTSINEVSGTTNEPIWVPEKQVSGEDKGIRHTFNLTQDAFNNEQLINHKKYFYEVIAYAYNNYEDFDPLTLTGQRKPYLGGRRINRYTLIPRPITFEKLNSSYGDGATITRLDGVGNGGTFLDLTEASRDAAFNGSTEGRITYLPNRGPIDVKIYNPFEIENGTYQLAILDGNFGTNGEMANWELTDANGDVTRSESTIEVLNEQILAKYGFTISIVDVPDSGDLVDESNGSLGIEIVYKDLSQSQWMTTAPRGVAPVNYLKPDNRDSTAAFSRNGGELFVPYTLTDSKFSSLEPPFFLNALLSPTWDPFLASLNNQVSAGNPLQALNNVDIVFTSDKSKWSRCVIVETANRYYYSPLGPTNVAPEGVDTKNFMLRQSPSVSKEADANGLPIHDNEKDVNGNPVIGKGWFPGYAIDIETGKRLNIFFGENSIYDLDVPPVAEMAAEGLFDTQPTGRDMMWNPTNENFLMTGSVPENILPFYGGGQHYIYVTREEYDECEKLHSELSVSDPFDFTARVEALKKITWTSFPLIAENLSLNSYAEGLIPNDAIVKLRVSNPYQVAIGTGANQGYPTYEITLDDVASDDLEETVEIDSALSQINVVPNPYYGFSDYETTRFSNTIKVTNLPAKATITIYTLDGKFVRQYKRDEVGSKPLGNNRALSINQINPDLEWDLNNNRGVPVTSGVYLIHVDAPGLGERVIKWFGVAR